MKTPSLIDLCADIMLAPFGMDHRDLPPSNPLPSAADLDAVAEEECARAATTVHRHLVIDDARYSLGNKPYACACGAVWDGSDRSLWEVMDFPDSVSRNPSLAWDLLRRRQLLDCGFTEVAPGTWKAPAMRRSNQATKGGQ
jgi:hypothetical protein